jgi:hypothetical protein
MRPISLAICLLAAALAGCEQPPPKLSGSGMDMFAPVKIRLHPLTRIVSPTLAPISAGAIDAPALAPSTAPASPPVLEARVEMSDQFSDPTKSPGKLSLSLYDQPPLTHKGPLLQSWPLSIDTPEENRAHWDRTTRTYLFKLPVTQPAGGLPRRDHLLAIVTLTLPNGAELTDELEVPLK